MGPQRTEDYIHRIGRTARAGKTGSALSFISESDKKIWKDICKLITPDEKRANDSNGLINNTFKLNNEGSNTSQKKRNNSRVFKEKYSRRNNEDSTPPKKKRNNSRVFKEKYSRQNSEDSKPTKKKRNNYKRFDVKYSKKI